MKKILVPTDFSPVADNALEYAIELAGWLESNIYLCHMYSFDKVTYNLEYPKDQQPYAKELERRMKRTKLKYSKRIEEKGLWIRTFVEEDTILSLFSRKVDEFGIDMIVLGSTGSTGISKIFFGSTAATALQNAKVPVLVVPPGHSFHRLKNIVLSIDHNLLVPNVLSALTELAKRFNAKVSLLNVIEHEKDHVGWKLGALLEGVETNFHEVRISKSINETINQFIEKEHCDLLCMIRRKRSFIRSVFRKSVTKAQVFSNKVPLLVLPEL
ncbi:universal stress protein [Aureitalea sp. L0-47]|uniref:universal stress protein n=1 Tax=Aureitalea sp. L0-47 TaxID=2816962 RepID=UPI0022372B25|nr:universal stress protein [Aureitalea sp. L0-47]MCW5518248.1 universal stress protein [Aureitalea sp. L0-47]